MRGLVVASTICLVAASSAASALPGWTPGSLAFAGQELIASQSGPVQSGSLRYYRTDVWRVPMLRRGRTGPERRVITVRTSAGPTATAPLVGAANGTFALIASGPDFTPPVVWCCDRPTGLQSVLESDGSPGARIPIAIGMSGPNVRYLARDGDASVVATVDPLSGSRLEVPIPGRPAAGLSAVSDDTIAWIDQPSYDRGLTIRRGRVGSRFIVLLGSVRPPGAVQELVSSGGAIAALARRGRQWTVIRASAVVGSAQTVWTGRARPVIATGDNQVAVAAGRTILVGQGRKLRVVARLARPARALAVTRARVAWLDWAFVGGRKRTVVRWIEL